MQANGPWWRQLSKAQWTILVLAWLGWVFDIMDSAIFAFAKTPMATSLIGATAYKDHGASVEGLAQTIFLVGWSIGGLFFGMLADRWGRTRTLVATVLMYCTFTGLTALVQTVPQLHALRFLTGLGIGGEWAAGAALVAEALPDRTRSAAASFLQSAAAIGPALAALANLWIGGMNLGSTDSWRWLFLIGVVPAIFTIVARWVKSEPVVTETKKFSFEPLVLLFRNKTASRNAILAVIIGFVGIAGAGNVTYWLPNLVGEFSKGLASGDIAARKSVATWVLHTGTLLGIIVVPWLCQVWGRKRTLTVFFIGSPLALLTVGTFAKSYESLLFLAPALSFFSIGLSAAFVLYFPELFPNSVRATGMGLAYNTGRILNAPVPALTGAIIKANGGSVVIGVATTAAIYLIGLIALPLAPETKGQSLPTG